jgi:hypothetical protein
MSESNDEVLHISPDDFTRPSLYFEEIERADGSREAGRSLWGAVSLQFTSDPHEICRHHDMIAVVNPENCREKWQFYNARIAPAPNSAPQPLNDFVMTFERCVRITDG